MKTIQGNTLCLFLLLPLLSFCLPPADENETIDYHTSPGNTPAVGNLDFIYGLAISNFTLINADTNEDLFTLKEGGIVNIKKVGATPLNIRANEIDPQSGIIVDFNLEGPVTFRRTERHAPYALFGDIDGNYGGMLLPEGTYKLYAGAYSVDSEGNSILINEISLSFIVGIEANEIVGFNLIEAEFDTDLDLPSKEYHIKDGQVFDSDNYPFFINGRRATSIKVSTNSYETGSVAFVLKGPITYSRTENKEPFTLFGDVAPDFYGKILPEGTYSLIATPYSEPNKQGKKGISKELHFTLRDLPEISIQEFAGFILATTNVEVSYLSPYIFNRIHQNEFPTDDVNIAVYPSYQDTGLGSVYLELQGPVTFKRTENVSPYALFGDINGDYQGMKLPPGIYNLRATPYTGPNRQGEAGLGYSYDFEIIEAPGELSLATDPVVVQKITLWPNPASDISSVNIDNKTGSFQVVLYDFGGRNMGEFYVAEHGTTSLDVSQLQKGIYFMRFRNPESEFTEVLVIR